jgi:GTP cyclohydrolase IA
MDEARLARAVREILVAIGEDPERTELRETPGRAARMYRELFGGVGVDPGQFLSETLTHQHRELIALRGVTVRSMCEHHLVPMTGVAHVAYIPNGRIVGFDRIVKVVDTLARRPQVQERLTAEIADVIDEHLQPEGVGVMLRLEQMCMTIRGERQTGSRTITTAYRGAFERDPGWREEFRMIIANPEASDDRRSDGVARSQ